MSDLRPPLLLAIDTSTTVASVALFDGEQVLAECTWVAGREHSRQLAPEVAHLLALAGRSIEDVTGLVAARGPGSFTGVRVGLSVAKGLAAGLGVPLWGVDTLAVLAAAAEEPTRPVRPVVDAGRGRVATALFQRGEAVEPMRGVAIAELSGLVSTPTVVIGDLPADVGRQLREVAPAGVRSPAASLRRAGYLALLGWQAALAGDPGDPAAVDAVYVPAASGRTP